MQINTKKKHPGSSKNFPNNLVFFKETLLRTEQLEDIMMKHCSTILAWLLRRWSQSKEFHFSYFPFSCQQPSEIKQLVRSHFQSD